MGKDRYTSMWTHTDKETEVERPDQTHANAGTWSTDTETKNAIAKVEQ